MKGKFAVKVSLHFDSLNIDWALADMLSEEIINE